MTQFFADAIDQLDLALDQIVFEDRNFDRFALVLIDNIIELTLHKFAQEKASEYRDRDYLNKRLQNFNSIVENETFKCPPNHDPKAIANGLSQNFDDKVKAASKFGLIDDSTRDSILNLHSFRNTAYHKGLRHENILHSLVIFYFKNACNLLSVYTPKSWSFGSTNNFSYRAMKYIGNLQWYDFNHEDVFKSAYLRLNSIVSSMPDRLIEDLAADLSDTIDSIDKDIDYLVHDGITQKNRNEVAIDAQADYFMFTKEKETEDFAKKNGYNPETNGLFTDWFIKNYTWDVKSDPIPSWRTRHASLTREKDNHKALKKYCDFIRQTENFRLAINDAVVALDTYINQQLDEMRER